MSSTSPLADAILASSPIAYWPMLSTTNLKDVIAGIQATAVGVSSGPMLSDDLRPSLLAPNAAGGIYVPHASMPSFCAYECMVRMQDLATYGWYVMFVGFNVDTTGQAGSGSALVRPYDSDGGIPYMTLKGVRQTTPAWSAFTKSQLIKPHHLYIEYIADPGQTVVYIDGVQVALVAGNFFEATAAGRNVMLAGQFWNGSMYGGTYVSDCAFYNRRLSSAEIAARVAAKTSDYPDQNVTPKFHAVAQTDAMWGNEQPPAELTVPDPFFASAQTDAVGIRWLSGAVTTPPQRDDYGYIEGKITRRGDVAASHIVACFDSGFNLIDTVNSGAAGDYRFDNLPLQANYMIVAMDNSTYTYNPAAADRRTPRAYS